MLFVNTDIPIKHKEAAWCSTRKQEEETFQVSGSDIFDSVCV